MSPLEYTRESLLEAMSQYRAARRTLLTTLGLPDSNRDPLAEFSEHLVATLTGSTLAPSRVQKGWDIETATGEHIQVRYLANPHDRWVNEHLVDFRSPETDKYALVVFEDLLPKAVLIFERSGVRQLASRLGKRHPDQDVTIQFTRRNFLSLVSDKDWISEYVQVIVF